MSRTPARTLRADGPDEVVPVPRRLDARLLVPVAVAWPIVAFVGLVVPATWVWSSALVSGLASGLLVLRQPRSTGRRLLALTLAVLSLVLLAVAGHRTVRAVGPLAELAEARAVATVRGVIATEPVVVGGSLEAGGAEAGGAGAGGAGAAGPHEEPTRDPLVVVRVDVRQVEGRGRVTEVSAPILVTGDRSWAERSCTRRSRRSCGCPPRIRATTSWPWPGPGASRPSSASRDWCSGRPTPCAVTSGPRRRV